MTSAAPGGRQVPRRGLPRRGLVALAVGCVAPALARAAPEPATLLVPAPPGSSPDRWAREVAPFLERAWPRQRLVLRNLPGRGGLAALAELAGTAPGARVIGVLTTPVLLARAVEANEPSPLDRIAPLGALIEEPVVLVAAPGGVASLEALRAETGVSFGTPPPGTAAHMAGMRLAESAGVTPLVFPSAAATRQAAAGGHVAAAALTLPDAIGFLRENRLVALGIAASRRSPLLPDLPTLREAGLELLGATRRGFALPPDAPADWRAWLVQGLEKLAEDPDLAAQCAEAGQLPRFLGPEPWTALLRRQEEALRRRWREEPWLPRRT
jgi:tripartite-type tricarboxylate transporter receptor subunit TctC